MTIDPPSRRAGPVPARGVALTGVIAVALHLPALVRRAALNSDEATIGTIARVLRHGGRLYSDIVDRKPPAPFLLYRLLEPLFGDWTLTAGRWVALAATVTAMWILAGEAHRRWPAVQPQPVAILGVVAFSLLPAEDSRAVGFELLATLPAVGAFVLGARGRTLAASIALGVAGLCKQPMLLGALPLAVQCLTMPGRLGRRLGRLVVAGVVTALTVVAGLAPFGLRDALSWYSGTGDNYLGGTRLASVVIVALEQLGSVLGLTMGLVILAVVGWRHRRPRVPLDLTAWIVAGLLATAIGLRFILHYFNQLLPPLVLLTGATLTSRVVLRTRLATFAVVWLAGGLAFSMWTLLAPAWFHDLPDVDRVAAAIDQRTEPGERIFVWGQAPEIYWVSERDPATRYPHVGFVTGVTPKRPGVPAYVLDQHGAAATLLGDLRRNPPALIVDAAIASVRGGNRYPLAGSPIAAFVAASYCEVDVVDGMRLLAPCRG